MLEYEDRHSATVLLSHSANLNLMFFEKFLPMGWFSYLISLFATTQKDIPGLVLEESLVEGFEHFFFTPEPGCGNINSERVDEVFDHCPSRIVSCSSCVLTHQQRDH